MALKVRQEELKRIMKARNLNIDQLAKELGVSRVYVQRILKEDLPVGAKFIEGLLELTKYTFDFLFISTKNNQKLVCFI
jgi:Helix-turn-helix.